MRVVAAIATACLLTSGCSAIVKQPSVTSVLADGAGLVAGVVGGMNVHCKLTDEVPDDCFGPLILGVYVGLPAVLLTAIFGGVALATDEAPPEPEMPTLAELGATADQSTSEVVAHQAWDAVERALPDVPTDDETLRLARQARAAAARGDCVAVTVTMARIEDRDARYHAALVRSEALSPCR